jgi:hypothetical protein
VVPLANGEQALAPAAPACSSRPQSRGARAKHSRRTLVLAQAAVARLAVPHQPVEFMSAHITSAPALPCFNVGGIPLCLQRRCLGHR